MNFTWGSGAIAGTASDFAGVSWSGRIRFGTRKDFHTPGVIGVFGCFFFPYCSALHIERAYVLTDGDTWHLPGCGRRIKGALDDARFYISCLRGFPTFSSCMLA